MIDVLVGTFSSPQRSELVRNLVLNFIPLVPFVSEMLSKVSETERPPPLT